jgi:mono/diheme cytochrome c family protein
MGRPNVLHLGRIRNCSLCFVIGCGCLLGWFLAQSKAEGPGQPTPEGLKFYEEEVRPILSANCFKCHSHETKKAKGGLVVDSLGGLLKGGDTGPAIVPGKPDKSLLIRAVRHVDDDLKMPAGGKKLSNEQIDRLVRWVKMGAPAPAADKAVTAGRSKITAEDRAWWAFQPVNEPPVPPAPAGWSRNPIDNFIHAKLAAEGLEPSPEAERVALCRRVTFDLTGLPPTPAEVDVFVADRASGAYERLVDRLLASPRYGEHWARHWLDLARYAESDGFRADGYRPNAWRYRDYVIRAFNEDKPYDRFVQEQLAGDEIAPDDPEALAATAFLRHTIYEYNQVDCRSQWADMLNDLTDVTGDVFLAMGMGCARCHDHKFDPILQKDYYSLQAFFASFVPRDNIPLATHRQRAEYQARLAKWESLTADVRKEIDRIEAKARESGTRRAHKRFPPDIQAILDKPAPARTPLEEQLYCLAYRQVDFEYTRVDTRMKKEEIKEVAALKKKIAAFNAQKPAPLQAAMTVTDVGPVAPPTFIPRKGKQPIEPAFPEVLGEKAPVIAPPPDAPKSTGRRTALARWLTRPDNPLTARVIVNRIWQYHFGRGLVATSSDFGRLGEKPSHPELLDWLAMRFVKEGWSFKKVHRLILTSATYRQSALAPAPAMALKKDPENRLLWRGSTRRLDAEQIRDAILAASGELDLQMGGLSVPASTPRRTIYVKVLRNKHDPLLDVFDAPEGFTSTAQRNVTTTPTQALLLFNGKQLQERAQAFARRLAREHPGGLDEQVAAAYRLSYGRPPEPAEQTRALQFLQDQARHAEVSAAGSGQSSLLEDFCHALLNSNEFIYVD